MSAMKHILSVLVENKPGVLSRVTGLISRRGFNIESLSVGPTEDPTMSRVTAIVNADDVAFEQITKQLHKLISVHKITDLTDDEGTVVNPHDVPANADHEGAGISCSSCHKVHTAEGAAQTAPTVCKNCHHHGVYECGTCHT